MIVKVFSVPPFPRDYGEAAGSCVLKASKVCITGRGSSSLENVHVFGALNLFLYPS